MIKSLVTLAMLCQVVLIANLSCAHEISGFGSAESRLFFSDARFPDQEPNSASVSINPEYYHAFNADMSFTFMPFVRLDSADSERSHIDIRELNVLWVTDQMEIRLGIGKVFWGVTEFLHLVDIINQTDLIESIDSEEKLGQPMIHISIPLDFGLFDFFLLPYFRERAFPGKHGRLRLPLIIDSDSAEYESSAEQHHVDVAARYSHAIGNCDFGIYHFSGTSREPTLIVDIGTNNEPFLVPFYELIDQSGLDFQIVVGQWLLKLEAIYQTGRKMDYFAAVGGFEYTFVNIAHSGVDLGVIGEWAHDDRGSRASTIFDNDWMVGLRVALNDMTGTEILAGFIRDWDRASTIVTVEASRRLTDRWKLMVEMWAFIDQPEDDLYYSLRDDDFLRVELAYYF